MGISIDSSGSFSSIMVPIALAFACWLNINQQAQRYRFFTSFERRFAILPSRPGAKRLAYFGETTFPVGSLANFLANATAVLVATKVLHLLPPALLENHPQPWRWVAIRCYLPPRWLMRTLV